MAKPFKPGDAKENRDLREDMLAALYGPSFTLLPGPKPDSPYMLGRIERTLSRYAGSQQTTFDRGATRSTASASSSQMQIQVDRAMALVLGRAPGSSSDSFAQALASAFPIGTDGQVATSPQRSAVQIFTGMVTSSTDGFNGLLSTRQATLARQTQLILSDTTRVLAAIQPFDPRAEAERVEAIRALCAGLFGTIQLEVTRVDEPRQARLDATLSALRSAVQKLGEAAYLDNPKLIATADDEGRAAGWRLLDRYVIMLRDVWEEYKRTELLPRQFSLSEVLERVNVELPVLTRSATNFSDALNSVGYVIDSDGRSRSDLFTVLGTPPKFPPVVLEPITTDSAIAPPRPDGDADADENGVMFQLAAMTPYDLSDWLSTFAGQEAPAYLSSSGIYGLTFVGNQTDSLFWTVAPILWLLTAGGINLGGDPTLYRLLTDERVRWSLDDLLVRLGTVADLVAAAE